MSLKRNFIKLTVICAFALCLFVQTSHAQFTGGLTVQTNPDGATVTLKGDVLVSGVTPTTFKQTLIGFYNITIERYGYENYHTKVILDPSKMMELNVSLTPKTRSKAAIRSLVIPGWGQRYANQKRRGFMYTLLATASAVGYFIADDEFDTRFNRFKDLEAEYDALAVSGSQAELEKLLPSLLNAQDKAYDAENVRRFAIGSAIAIWSLSVIDALFFFPEEKGTFKVKNLTLTPEASAQNVGINLSYHF